MTARRVLRLAGNADPYPDWTPTPSEIEMWSSGDEATYIRRSKAARRAQRHLQHALAGGAIDAWFLDPPLDQSIPCWAWSEDKRCIFAWGEGRLPMNVLLPDPWPRWSSHQTFLSRESFARWYGSELPTLGPPPDCDPQPSSPAPELVASRPLPDRPHVDLADALSWIAFGIALNAGSLFEALKAGQLGGGPEWIEHRLCEAMERLADAIVIRNVRAYGKHVPNLSEGRDALTELIDPIRIMDYRRVDILTNSLRFGTGLTTRVQTDLTTLLGHGGRRDTYRDVRLDRADLEKHFSPKNAPKPKSGDEARKRLPDAKLDAWIKALGERADLMTQSELLASARASFPKHAIARDRIRTLTKGRAPGPKRLAGNRRIGG